MALMLDGEILMSNLKESYKGEKIPSKVRQSIKDTPLIDNSNILYAYWKKDRVVCGTWICSNCCYIQNTRETDDIFLRDNHFCPHCGAYMHGKEQTDGNDHI